MKAPVVIGANYGDEGKGLMTDYLCRDLDIQIVARFNGGAQAGHTVVDPTIGRHVFGHFGAGTFAGVPTFLSKYFVCNPALFDSELDRFPRNVMPVVYVDPAALVTTPWDMLINQAIEEKRGARRHGSCGVGFNETVERSVRGYPLYVSDLIEEEKLTTRLTVLALEYYPARCTELGIVLDQETVMRTVSHFVTQSASFIDMVKIAQPFDALSGRRVLFEGAQGLMLDQDHPNFPHVTRSKTGLTNALKLATEAKLEVDPIYVSRTYLTRHGAGPLSGEEPMPKEIVDKTNVEHPFQGVLRYAPLDAGLAARIHDDAGQFGLKPKLAMTWADAPTCVTVGMTVSYASYGPEAKDVMAQKSF